MHQSIALLTMLVAFVAAYFLRFDSLEMSPPYLAVLLIAITLSIIILPATGSFRPGIRNNYFRQSRRLLAGWAVIIMLLVVVAALLKVSADYSRIWFGTWVGLTTLGLLLGQAASFWANRRFSKWVERKKVVLVGSGYAAREVDKQIDKVASGGVDLLMRFGTPWSDAATRPIAEIADYIRQNPVDEVLIAVPWEQKSLLESTLEMLKDSTVDINVVPDLFSYRLLNQGLAEWNGLPVISLCSVPMTMPERLLKAAMDRTFSFLLLVLLAPLMLLIALIIRLTSKGPAIFRQQRHGMANEPIEVLKFRTMRVEAAADAPDQAVRGDARVTGFGRILRKTSLDELPQLINVLKGEMSLVGPRPHAVEHNEDYKSRIPKYMLRHKVKPGMTGWAQVNGLRGLTETDDKMARRIEYDLWYIQNWTVWLDLRILLLTPLVVLFQKNAF